MANLRNAVQQYGAIIESLVRAFLSFAPVAASIEDTQTEQTIQFVQSVSDLVALRHDKYMKPGASGTDVCLFSSSCTLYQGIKFLLRVLKCFQLWAEMRSKNPRQLAMRLEGIRLVLAMVVLRESDARLPDIEFDSSFGDKSDVYVGSRTGTKLRTLSRLLSPGNGMSETQFSDFLHAIVPVVYLAASPEGGWQKPSWTSWVLAFAIESASILALPEGSKVEKKLRFRRLLVESLMRRPAFDVTINRSAQVVSNLWNKIPLLRDFNYLEYYLHMHNKFFYFHQ